MDDDHPLSANLVVSADAASPGSARSAVRDLCASAAFGPDAAETATLLVSELVTNALEHGGGTAVLEAVADRRCLRVAVADDDPTLPRACRGAVDDERGRGLMLVDTLASRWGAAAARVGKTVWFELDRA